LPTHGARPPSPHRRSGRRYGAGRGRSKGSAQDPSRDETVQPLSSPPPEDHHHARGEIAITTLATVKTARRLARRRTRLPGERSSKTMPSGQFHHPARRIFSRSRSAFVSVAFITGRVTCP